GRGSVAAKMAGALACEVVAIALLGAGCGPGRDDCTCATNGAEATAISGNHGHALTVPASDFDAFASRNYQIRGSADHDHVVNFTAQQFQVLSNGGTAKSTSSETDGHTHEVTIGCACD
ncbi:MAG: hypothetical protein JXR83_21865, partial [Deltaproteobacteria bacterium]|nr:hypothetical protein [Deltaproteobacteria bacterium]